MLLGCDISYRDWNRADGDDAAVWYILQGLELSTWWWCCGVTFLTGTGMEEMLMMLLRCNMPYRDWNGTNVSTAVWYILQEVELSTWWCWCGVTYLTGTGMEQMVMMLRSDIFCKDWNWEHGDVNAVWYDLQGQERKHMVMMLLRCDMTYRDWFHVNWLKTYFVKSKKTASINTVLIYHWSQSSVLPMQCCVKTYDFLNATRLGRYLISTRLY